jgi:hypothetical protein
MRAIVCILVHGAPGYFAVAAEAIRAVLSRTPFDVFVGFDGDASLLPHAPRVTLHALRDRLAGPARPYRFLLKFDALAACLASGDHELILQMDADALPVRRLTADMLFRALDGRDFGMVEQTTIIGSTMGRRDFLQYYAEYSLPVIAPDAPVPALEDFRFFNAGVVIARRAPMAALAGWAQRHIEANVGRHEIGAHMVADQDYFQVWTNTLHPGCCTQLPWYWNHCEYWDAGFPRAGALIAHFSNFCSGPADATPGLMRALRKRTSVWRHSAAATLRGYR